MNKINPAEIIKKVKSFKIKSNKQPNKVKLPEQKPDTFEYVNKAKDYAEEMATMKFEKKNIKFLPEDIERMKGMSREEKMAYVKELRENKKYIELPDDK